MKKKQGRPEELLQIKIVAFLRDLRAWTGDLTFTHVPFELLRTSVLRRIYWTLGCEAGVPDLMIFLKGGTTIFIELKAGRRKRTDKQKEWMDNIERLGFPAYTVNADTAKEGIDKVVNILRHHGLNIEHLTSRGMK